MRSIGIFFFYIILKSINNNIKKSLSKTIIKKD